MTSTEPAPAIARHADRFDPIAADREQRWHEGYDAWPHPLFPRTFGALIDEVRLDYCRMSLPYRPELQQPAGYVHGGALATLIDTAALPACGSAYEQLPILLTVDMQLRYLGAAREVGVVAEAWVTKRGRSVCFCQAEVRRQDDGELVAEGWLVYRVIEPQPAAEGA